MKTSSQISYILEFSLTLQARICKFIWKIHYSTLHKYINRIIPQKTAPNNSSILAFTYGGPICFSTFSPCDSQFLTGTEQNWMTTQEKKDLKWLFIHIIANKRSINSRWICNRLLILGCLPNSQCVSDSYIKFFIWRFRQCLSISIN